MKKEKRNFILFLICLSIIGLFVPYFSPVDWPIRFKSELDQFFGKGSWTCTSKELDYTTIGDDSREYKKWSIQLNDDSKTTYEISSSILKYNEQKYWLFSPKRLSNRQALILELMDISFIIASDKLFNEIITPILSETEANCLDVSISYHGGNPNPEFYNKLFKESWFTINNVSAENFLESDLHDFYVDIRVYDYKASKLTSQEQQNLFNSLELIEQKLLKKYRNNASFKIYFDKENQVEYIDGIKQ